MNNEPEFMYEDEGANTPELLALEQELRQALAPVELPAGFADRVLAAAAVQPPKRARVLPFRNWRLATGGAIAAALLLGSFAAEDVRQHHQRARERAMANQQFETATHITDEALAHTRAQLERAGVLQGN